MKRIPFKVLPLDDKEANAVKDVVANKSISLGHKVKELEENIADYIGSKYAVAVDSCTSALFLSLKYCALNNLGKLPMAVEVPSMTVPLVANTVLHAGGEIKFVDKCDWVGHSYQLKPYPIIDSAHKVSKDQFKEFSDETMLCYSFYPTKPITSAEGGIIATNNKDAVDWLVKARYYGRNSDSTFCKSSWEYDIEFPGWKMNMTDIQAVMAIEQLKKLPEVDRRRLEVVERYNKNLGKTQSSLYLYRIDVKNRDEFLKYMKDGGVECGIHFKPLHLYNAFKDAKRTDLTETEKRGKTTVSLPLYDSLSIKEVDYISELVKIWKEKE